MLQIEELQKIVFWKSKNNKDKEDDKNNDKNWESWIDINKKKPDKSSWRDKRSSDSYKREIPDEEDVTDNKEYNITNCPVHPRAVLF